MASGIAVSSWLTNIASSSKELQKYLYIKAKINEAGTMIEYVSAEKYKKEPGDEDDKTLTFVPENEQPRESVERLRNTLFRDDHCFYLIYNLYYGPNNLSAKFVIVRWSSDDHAKLTDKMCYSSSSDNLRAKTNPTWPTVQCCSLDEFAYDDLLRKAGIKTI
ncbi:uncharacterized protein LOC117115299 [Anneissia japonica]|uniref:uncharacterized protein LOC117115299 n=1 Tax=Anneissia japonica TaxID=1529436 RepID=UPI0014259A2D|nr:uncharacterized protein LOC117115299 [Anneissia japonica]